MAPNIRIDSGWSDLVFHVLAHVDLRGVAPNVFDTRYVRWVEQHAGPAGERTLAEDASALARLLLADPVVAIAVQALAVLFDGIDQAQRAAERELGELSGADVVSPAALRALVGALPAAELLRCAALLEADVHRRLLGTGTGWSEAELQLALVRVAECAPRLAQCELVLCRALTRHGRVFGTRLYAGVPAEALGVSAEQVALQAGHEASVLEASEAARAAGLQLNERAVEAVAVVLFAQRCTRAGLAEAHARWGAQWGVRAEHGELASLPEPERALVTERLQQG